MYVIGLVEYRGKVVGIFKHPTVNLTNASNSTNIKPHKATNHIRKHIQQNYEDQSITKETNAFQRHDILKIFSSSESPLDDCTLET